MGFGRSQDARGVGLLDVIGVASDVGPDEANEDGSAVISFLTVEFAATVIELADERYVQGAIIDIVERLAPLMGLGVVGKKRSFPLNGVVEFPASSSSTLARPFHIFLTVTVLSDSTQVLEQVSG
jgi:hypothetical protein